MNQLNTLVDNNFLGKYVELLEKENHPSKLKIYYDLIIECENMIEWYNLVCSSTSSSSSRNEMKRRNDRLDMITEKCDGDTLYLVGFHYHHIKEHYDKMKKYYNMAIIKGCNKPIFNLCYYYLTIKDYDNMMVYYNMGVACDDNNISYCLGLYYETVEKDYNNMKKYYNMAIENNSYLAMCDIERIKKAISQIPIDTVKKNSCVVCLFPSKL